MTQHWEKLKRGSVPRFKPSQVTMCCNHGRGQRVITRHPGHLLSVHGTTSWSLAVRRGVGPTYRTEEEAEAWRMGSRQTGVTGLGPLPAGQGTSPCLSGEEGRTGDSQRGSQPPRGERQCVAGSQLPGARPWAPSWVLLDTLLNVSGAQLHP